MRRVPDLQSPLPWRCFWRAATVGLMPTRMLRFEGPPEMQSAIVQYEAELEFTADTYFHTDHKAGDRAPVQGEIEYVNESGNWRLLTMGIYPR